MTGSKKGTKHHRRDPFMQKDMSCSKCKKPIFRVLYGSYNENGSPVYIRTLYWHCPECREFFMTEMTPIAQNRRKEQ